MGILGTSRIFSFLALSSILLFSTSIVTAFGDDFLECLNIIHLPNTPTIPIYTQNNASYETILRFSERNERFSKSIGPKYIITPTHESHVQASVICCKKHGLDLKVRSGGHDAEGLSYQSDDPSFVILNFVDFRNVSGDVNDGTAWIQAGAILSEKSKTYGFPAVVAPTIGIGGHISGGGIVIDARIVNVDGKILNKQTMSADLFWAIRGGGGGNFGVILSWKVKLVPGVVVRFLATTTIANIQKTLGQGATDLVHKWQFIAHKLDVNIHRSLLLSVVSDDLGKERTVQASFSILFVGDGGAQKIVQLLEESFPELGLKIEDCIQITWVESHLYLYGSYGQPLETFLVRETPKIFFKQKRDHVTVPIPKNGLLELWRTLLEHANFTPTVVFLPYGGKMSEISDSELPYPDRQAIYLVFYDANWANGKMTPYVSKSPRTALVNARDLDLGRYENAQDISYQKGRSWGIKYFKNNFDRLVKVKTQVDPENFFWNVQSIPPITHMK
ncbi:hypothetical protein MKW98_009280 [Papaver atlanticum]|uniref:FAD-binding PCMH-type domain-containing protein n=1 Tax=Papaver atlanticum TaxID=357466 RepID=A0AAD4XPQ7_9MAGN|nr:hypothetical protein MKW98_009280 [Papaver atlanticum]